MEGSTAGIWINMHAPFSLKSSLEREREKTAAQLSLGN